MDTPHTQYKIKVLHKMIRLYCRHREKNQELCPSCRELLSYASERVQHCPFHSQGGSCQHCRIHCYKPAMREKIRIVMRYAGPRMLWYHPIAAIRHLLSR